MYMGMGADIDMSPVPLTPSNTNSFMHQIPQNLYVVENLSHAPGPPVDDSPRSRVHETPAPVVLPAASAARSDAADQRGLLSSDDKRVRATTAAAAAQGRRAARNEGTGVPQTTETAAAVDASS
jgi:hypothetical protein